MTVYAQASVLHFFYPPYQHSTFADVVTLASHYHLDFGVSRV